MTADIAPARRRRRRSKHGHGSGRSARAPFETTTSAGVGSWSATGVLLGTALLLPLMLGNRTPEAVTASLLLLVSGTFLAVLLVHAPRNGAAQARAIPPVPGAAWILFSGVFTGLVLLQVLPSPGLAAAFGPYPAAVSAHPEFVPRFWSPDVGASLRGWAAFVALFTAAWIAYGLNAAQRNLLWLGLAGMAVFQAGYGVAAHAAEAQTIFGVWPRNNPGFVHGSFSNRNLFAAYLALLWPLTVAVWWLRDMPLLGRLPKELKVVGTVITSAVIGAALLASASRLGSAAGVAGMLMALVLWSQHQKVIRGAVIWPVYLAFGVGLLAATWYGLTPLAERLLATGSHDGRFEVFALMLSEFPSHWYLHGIGLGGFEAAFKQVQPAHIAGWYDYAHNDLLQWLVETGLIGAGLLVAVGIGLVRARRLSIERIPLYAGLGALAMVGLGDFSWHIPATQVVLALFLGTLLRVDRDSTRER